MPSGFVKIAKQGVRLFPLHGKVPAVREWKQVASKDADKIEEWEAKGYTHFGIPTDVQNGFLVLDLDKYKEGYNFDREGDLPQTLSQVTQNGGVHYFFKQDPQRVVRNGANLSVGVDVRGDGGYVVTCPSPGYRFQKKGVKFSDDIAPAPEWLLDMILKPSDRKSSEETIIPIEQVRETLFLLDPYDPQFESREGWQELMRACHSATAGDEEGRLLFQQWSLQHQGPWKSDVKAEIRRDWNSYTSGKQNATTWGTMCHYLKERGLFLTPTAPKVTDTVELAPVSNSTKKEQASFHVNKDGRIKPTLSNLNLLMTLDKVNNERNPIKDLVVYDEFQQHPVFFNAPPWDDSIKVGHDFHDSHAVELQMFFSEKYGVEYSKSVVTDAITTVAKRNPNHPVRNYLESLAWDGTPRLHRWLNKWCGTPQNEYVSEAGIAMLVGAVNRIYVPGCQMDNMMILEGPQGARKTSFLRELGKGWYSAPQLPFGKLIDGKSDAITNCFGSWIIEVEEMASVSQVDEKTMKKFLTTREDVVTLKYDKFRTTHKRQFVFFGTINLQGDGKYLRDPTGGRRYWPINVRKTERNPIDVNGFKLEVDQLWAEAVHLYKGGRTSQISNEAKRLAEIEQKHRQVCYPGIDIAEDWILANLADDDRCHTITAAQGIWGFNVKQVQLSLVASAFTSLGWVFKRNLYIEGRNRSGFIKPSETDEID